MRLAIPLLAAVALIGWIACTLPGSVELSSEERSLSNPWRRTLDGWEDFTHGRRMAASPAKPPVPHPAIVALWQVLMAATIGVATLPGPR